MSCRRFNRTYTTPAGAPVPQGIGGRSQRGAALIVALLVFAVASALMVGLQRDFTLQLQRGSNAFIAEQGWSYLRGAEALASTALRFDADQDRERGTARDDLTEVWASEATPYPLPEGGWLLGQLEDLQGRLNLNSLVSVPGSAGSDDSAGGSAGDADSTEDSGAEAEEGGATLAPAPPPEGAGDNGANRFNTAQKMLIRLLQTLDGPISTGPSSAGPSGAGSSRVGSPSTRSSSKGPTLNQSQAIALTEAITDFIDGDDQRRFEGAEDEAYRNTQPAYRAANQPLASVSELRSVSGMTPEIYAALAPLVTVWPVEGSPLNILTAKPEVLRCLNTDEQLEPLSLVDAQRLTELRTTGEIDSVNALLEDITLSGGATTALKAELAETSSWFLLTANVQLGERELQLYSVLERKDRRVVSRYRSMGEL